MKLIIFGLLLSINLNGFSYDEGDNPSLNLLRLNDLLLFGNNYVYSDVVFSDYNTITKNIKPPLSTVRIGGEVLLGGIGGILGAWGGTVGSLLIRNDPCDGFCIDDFFVGIITGTLGMTTGVYLIGNIGNETGSFSKTLVGSLIGVAGGGVLVLLKNYVGAVIVTLSAPVIAFNATRKYKDMGDHITIPEEDQQSNIQQFQSKVFNDIRLSTGPFVSINIIHVTF